MRITRLCTKRCFFAIQGGGGVLNITTNRFSPTICWGKSGWPNAATYFTQFLCLPKYPPVTISIPTLQAHPTVPGDLPPFQGAASDTGFLHVSLSGSPKIELHYCITTWAVLMMPHKDILENGYDLFYFTPFSSKAAWISLNPRRSITDTISPQHTEAAPTNITSSSSISMTSFPPNHPNPPPTAPFDQTTARINLMTQKMHQNAALMTQLHHQASPTVPQTLPPQNLKVQHPPFTKWDGYPTTKLPFLAQVGNDKT